MWYSFQNYREASRSVKAFVWTVILMALTLIISTVWAYVRLYTARTDIPNIENNRIIPKKTP